MKKNFLEKLKMPKIINDRAVVMSEYGGYVLNTENHVWSDKTFGYKKMKNKKELEEAYVSLIKDQLIPLKESGLCAAVYTQTTDVEIEINGFYTYDREVLKMNKEVVRKVNLEVIK